VSTPGAARATAPHSGARRKGFGLAGHFYADESIYRLDLARIWRANWLYVGPSCEITDPGAFLTVTIAGDPILIVRGADRSLQGFHNVCRHRGSIVVTAARGHLDRLVCPYHRWTYARTGELIACPGLAAEHDRAQLALKAVSILEVAGLVFVALGEAPDPAEMRADLARAATTQGLERAVVAARNTYIVHANWKLVWENNRECLHCVANHPEYVRANFDRFSDEAARRAGLEAALVRHAAALRSEGAVFGEGGLYAFPDGSGRTWSTNRTALRAGYTTESLDGLPVAPLMGDYADRDVGTLRLRSLPNLWCHASGDHAVITRLLPRGAAATEAEVTWLVDGDAVEGRDYDLERLVAFWQRTSEQDWLICERQQLGVNSSAFVPGPLSAEHEGNVDRFLDWYLDRVGPAAR
jgi:glycine betaine monooxygenase A